MDAGIGEGARGALGDLESGGFEGGDAGLGEDSRPDCGFAVVCDCKCRAPEAPAMEKKPQMISAREKVPQMGNGCNACSGSEERWKNDRWEKGCLFSAIFFFSLRFSFAS